MRYSFIAQHVMVMFVPIYSIYAEAAESYRWEEPAAWSSQRLYAWGRSQQDSNILDAPEHWSKYYLCESVPLNGKAGALFFNERHYVLHVSA